ncbi:hypothetical protein LSH36_788g03036 [Paralvinella palmiformis]|uniref:Uncharacterized protein n=1 Tax=Paralvinella palmiformis TaxID=53620 RepID=A0AAD9MSF3_9ANNE|nr:hypothetical protein LSH36_788g03036 [Paralvinella palmiformis]
MSRVDLKIVLLGKEYGGKTSLVERYLHDRFLGHVPYQSTIGAAFGGKKIQVNGKKLILGIWNCKIYLCGTKKDIVDDEKNMRQVDYHMTTDFADEIDALVYETSSKTGENISELFLKIASDFLANSKSSETPNNVLHLEEGKTTSKCC